MDEVALVELKQVGHETELLQSDKNEEMEVSKVQKVEMTPTKHQEMDEAALVE